jgi:exosortase
MFIIFFLGSLVVFWMPLKRLITFSLSHDYASHILLVVPASACLIYRKRSGIFATVQAGLTVGSLLLLAGAGFFWLAERYLPTSVDHDQASLSIFAIVLIWIAGFIFCYGTQAFAIARFPLLFLLLLVPIPATAVEKVIFVLQSGSANVAYWLLWLLGVPVFKRDFVLLLPTLAIEVAKECSGIRSSLALLITTLLMGELVLRSGWRKALLVLSTVPMLIFKNGVRIVAVSLLSIYVNPGFLHGWLHTSGGIVFYLLGLALLMPILEALRKSEDANWATLHLHPSEVRA